MAAHPDPASVAGPQPARTLEAIPPAECWQLIASVGVGRLAVARGADPPLVVPVNYVLDGEQIVFRSDPGSKLAHLNRAVTFQVDQIDHYHRAGWSVLVHGTVHEVEEDEVEHLWLTPWVGERRLWIRVVPTVVTGRRILLADIDTDPRGYL